MNLVDNSLRRQTISGYTPTTTGCGVNSLCQEKVRRFPVNELMEAIICYRFQRYERSSLVLLPSVICAALFHQRALLVPLFPC